MGSWPGGPREAAGSHTFEHDRLHESSVRGVAPIREIDMQRTQSRYGLLVSALGASLLAAATFLPWYGASAAAGGPLSDGQQATLAPYEAGLRDVGRLAPGEVLGAASAMHVLSYLSALLLALAALALLDALLPLIRRGEGPSYGAGGALVPLGLVASALIAYRMIAPPTPAGVAVTLSLHIGAWLALLGALAMALGGMWPRALPALASSEDIFTSLSVWTSTS